jgi:GTP 3',8-cyclase
VFFNKIRNDMLTITDTSPKLIDQFGRNVDYIRLSITDRCDFRCQYCMAENMTFLPRNEVLTLEECARIIKVFVQLGVTKVRITGGEPLVRKNAMWLFEEVGRLKDLQELVLTTNGSQLTQYANSLIKTGVKRINISIDSLKPDRFKEITRTGNLDKVLAGLQACISEGFEGIKLNTVLMRGINDDEAVDLVQFAIDHKIDISFIEEMPLGEVNHTRDNTFISNADTLKLLQSKYSLLPSTINTGGPARYWQVADSKTKVGFISPHSHNFCESCNRVRITCQGELYLCLGQEDKVELLPLLRSNPNNDAPLIEAIINSMKVKPKGHDFDIKRAEPSVIRFMSHTGG